MRVSEVLAVKGRTTYTIDVADSLRQAAQLLMERNIGAAICTDRTGGIVGMLSERDVARAFARLGADVVTLTVGEAMSRDVVACAGGDSVEDILEIMTETRCRHIPVIQDGALLGLVSIGDLVKAQRQD